MKLKTLKEHLEIEYGKVGTPKREKFDKNSKTFIIGELRQEKSLILSKFLISFWRSRLFFYKLFT